MISLILIIIASFAKAVMDTINFHWYDSIFKNIKNQKWREWTNPEQSYALKWKNYTPESGEAFWGSSTIFVWLTDLWHLAQAIELTALFGAIVMYQPLTGWFLDFLILKSIFILIFMLFYRKIFYKRSLVK